MQIKKKRKEKEKSESCKNIAGTVRVRIVDM